MDKLEGKVAIVTGAASGIGYAMAQSLAANGVRVVMADVEEEALMAAAESFGDTNAEIKPVLLDVTDRDRFAEVADEVEAEFGKIHILCNNAGVGAGGHVADMTYKDWDWIMRVNVDGVINGMVTCTPRIRAHGEGGHIVNTASMAGQIGIPNLSVYNTSKFAVVGMSESAHQDLAADNIGVSVLCPNMVRTRILESGRNRPKELQGEVDTASMTLSADVTEEERAERNRMLMENAIEPSVVGDMVVDAIRNNDLYIFTHPESAEMIKGRFAQLMAAQERWAAWHQK